MPMCFMPGGCYNRQTICYTILTHLFCGLGYEQVALILLHSIVLISLRLIHLTEGSHKWPQVAAGSQRLLQVVTGSGRQLWVVTGSRRWPQLAACHCRQPQASSGRCRCPQVAPAKLSPDSLADNHKQPQLVADSTRQPFVATGSCKSRDTIFPKLVAACNFFSLHFSVFLKKKIFCQYL